MNSARTNSRESLTSYIWPYGVKCARVQFVVYKIYITSIDKWKIRSHSTLSMSRCRGNYGVMRVIVALRIVTRYTHDYAVLRVITRNYGVTVLQRNSGSVTRNPQTLERPNSCVLTRSFNVHAYLLYSRYYIIYM